MKAIISLILTLSRVILFAQFNIACLPEGILFSSQAEIDEFPVNSAGCEVIMGNVKISGPDITDLNGLSTIKIIEGNLWFHKNISLESLNGLENLTTIKGNLWLDSNAVLVNLNGLNNLTSIGGELWIYRHFDLLNLEGLENLTYLPDDIVIDYNNDMISLAGLVSGVYFVRVTDDKTMQVGKFVK